MVIIRWLLVQSKECLEKVAKTVSFLAQPEGSFLLLLTGNRRSMQCCVK